MKLWVDDVRPMPDGFAVHAHNFIEAITAIEKYGDELDLVSLDHDLGEELTGYDIAKYITRSWEAHQLGWTLVECHSANPVGRDNILTLIRRTEERIWGIQDDSPCEGRGHDTGGELVGSGSSSSPAVESSSAGKASEALGACDPPAAPSGLNSAEGIGAGGGCDCPPGRCIEFEWSMLPYGPERCVFFLARTKKVVTAHCMTCQPPGGATWHADGSCLRCLHLAGDGRIS